MWRLFMLAIFHSKQISVYSVFEQGAAFQYKSLLIIINFAFPIIFYARPSLMRVSYFLNAGPQGPRRTPFLRF